MGKRFHRVNVEITNVCNLQCSFCPEVHRTKNRMEVDRFRDIIAEIAPVSRTVALHLMGDPLVHPELEKLLDICGEHALPVFLVTNGVLLRERESRALLHPILRQVSFSLHSYADNFGDRDPGEYLDRIFSYTELAFSKLPRLFINYRLWNLQEPRGTHTHHLSLIERIEERFQVRVPRHWDTTSKKNFVVKNRLSLHFDTEFVWPGEALPFLGETGTCYGLRSHFGVLVDGTVVPCCLDKEGVIALGRLSEQPLVEILSGPRAHRMKLGFESNHLVEDLCRRCRFIERFETPLS